MTGVASATVAFTFLILLEALLSPCRGGEAEPGAVRVNCGGDDAVLFDGRSWEADNHFSEGMPAKSEPPQGASTPQPVAEIFTTRRVFSPPGTGGCYRFPLPLKRYVVRISFAPTELSSCDFSSDREAQTNLNTTGATPDPPAATHVDPRIGNKDRGVVGSDSQASPTADGRDVQGDQGNTGDQGSIRAGAVQESAWIAVAVLGQQMEVVRTELHQRYVYRTEYTVDTSTGEHNASTEQLNICFGALKGAAYVSAIEVLPVPDGLYSRVYGEGPTPRGVLASRDRLAAAATFGLPTRDVADRKWHSGNLTYGRGVTAQDLTCSGKMAATLGSSRDRKDSAPSEAHWVEEEAGRSSGAAPPTAGAQASSGVLASGHRTVWVSQPDEVEGANDPPFYLSPGMLRAVFEANSAWHRLHLEWHFRAVSCKNPWVLVLALLEPNASAVVGERVFDIVVNGEVVVQGFDALAQQTEGDVLKVATTASVLGKNLQGVGTSAKDRDQQQQQQHRQSGANSDTQGRSAVEYRLGGASVGGQPQLRDWQGAMAKEAQKKWARKFPPPPRSPGADAGKGLLQGKKDEAGGGQGGPVGSGVGAPGGSKAQRRVRFVVVTVWNRRPSFLRTLPSLEVDLVRAPGSKREPAVCAVELFEVFKGVSMLNASTHIGGGEEDGLNDTPVRVESESDPFATPEGTGSGSQGGVIAAAVIASVGGVALVVSVALLGFLWRRHSLRRAERLRQVRTTSATSSLSSLPGSSSSSQDSVPDSEATSPMPGESPERPSASVVVLEEAGVAPLVPPGREQSAALRPRRRSALPRTLSEIREEEAGNASSSTGDVEMGVQETKDARRENLSEGDEESCPAKLQDVS